MQIPRIRCRFAIFGFIVACEIARLAFAQQPANAQSTSVAGKTAAVDCFGDPLPPGANLRMGTVRLRLDGAVEGVAFSPDGKSIVTTGWDDSIRIWDVESGSLTRRLAVDELDDATFAAAFSPDGGKLASVSERGFVRLWDAHTGRLLSKTLGHTERDYGTRVFGVAFSPDGRSFATAGSDKPVRIWDAATGDKLKELQSESGGVDSRPVAYSRDGKLLASGDQSGTIQIWNLEEGAAKKIPKAHQRDITALAFTQDRKSIISCGTRFQRTGSRSGRLISQIHVWDVATGEKQTGFDAGEELAGDCTLAISRDGSLLASAHDEKIVIWDTEKRVPIIFIREEKNYFGGRAHRLAISPDNSLVAAGVGSTGTDKVFLWNLKTGEAVLLQADTHFKAVLATDVSPDGKLIVTSSADGAVRLWDANSGKHIRLIDRGSGWVRYVQFFSDGQSIALGRETYTLGKPKIEGEVKICRTADASVVHHWPVPDRVMCGTLSPNRGQKLAVGIGTGIESGPGFGGNPDLSKIIVWNTQSGKKVNETSGSPSQFQQLRFTDDGDELWSASRDLLVRKWSMTATEEIDSYPLTAAEHPGHFNWSLIIPGSTRLLQRGLERVKDNVSQGKLTVADFEKDEIVWEKTFEDSWPREFAVSADGKLLAAFFYPLSGSKGVKRIAVLATDDGRELLSLDLPDGTVRTLAFSPDGSQLLSGMEASDVLVWELSRVRKALKNTGK